MRNHRIHDHSSRLGYMRLALVVRLYDLKGAFPVVQRPELPGGLLL